MDVKLELVPEFKGVQKNSTSAAEMEQECVICKVKTTKKCYDCSKAYGVSPVPYYCGKEHQLEHWPQHKPVCQRTLNRQSRKLNGLLGVRPVDELVDCIFKDFLPGIGTQCYKTFGFSKCKTEKDETYLLGLYVGLIKILRTDLDLIDEAVKNGQLAQLICNQFETELPDPATRGAYYPWFLQNKHIVQ